MKARSKTEFETFWAQPFGPCCALPCALGVVVLLRIAQTLFLECLKHCLVLELGAFSSPPSRFRLPVREDAAIENP